MNALQAIAIRLQTLSTVLDFEQETALIAAVQGITPDEAAADWTTFCAVVSHIRDSHQTHGIFGVTPQNQHIFIGFADYLTRTARYTGQTGAALCDGFGLTAAEIAAAFAEPPADNPPA